MIIKKFTAKTEDDALKAARAELGAQAVIMNVKKVKKKGIAGLFSRPSVEVTAAIEEEKTDDNEIFEVAEVQPEFPGGMDALMAYLQKNIKYPSRAQENNIKGTVVCRFVVGKDGSVSNVSVAKSLDPDCDREATRVIAGMPKWKPGKQSGKPVNCYFTVPVRFVLQ